MPNNAERGRRLFRAQADRCYELKGDFLAAAETWEKLANEVERRGLFRGVIPMEGRPGGGRAKGDA